MTRGFTLLELLVGIAVFSVLGLMAVGGLTSALRADETVRTQQSRLARVQFAIGLIERDVAQAIDRTVRDALGDELPAARGQKTLLELTRGGRSNPLALRRAELERVRYRLDGNTLERTSWTMLDRGPGTQPRTTDLLQNVTDLNVRWLTEGRRWLDAWPAARNQWPIAVEVRIELGDLGPLTRLIPMADGRLDAGGNS